MERYLRVNLLGPGPRLMKKEFTGSQSHKGKRNTGVDYCFFLHTHRHIDTPG